MVLGESTICEAILGRLCDPVGVCHPVVLCPSDCGWVLEDLALVFKLCSGGPISAGTSSSPALPCFPFSDSGLLERLGLNKDSMVKKRSLKTTDIEEWMHCHPSDNLP